MSRFPPSLPYCSSFFIFTHTRIITVSFVYQAPDSAEKQKSTYDECRSALELIFALFDRPFLKSSRRSIRTCTAWGFWCATSRTTRFWGKPWPPQSIIISSPTSLSSTKSAKGADNPCFVCDEWRLHRSSSGGSLSKLLWEEWWCDWCVSSLLIDGL